MNRKSISPTIRFFQALFLALLVVAGFVGPAKAQSTPPPTYEKARLVMQDGWTAIGRHAIADDFVIACPNTEVLDPSHPCSNSYNGGPVANIDDLVLVCPNKEVLDPSHACANRRSQIIEATADDFVLVCPVKKVLDPSHPCAQRMTKPVNFKIPGDFVLTCPVKEVLEPQHPCAE